MTHHVTLIYGDGIGPEVVSCTKEIIDACGVDIVWHEKLLGLEAFKRLGTPVPDDTIMSIKETKTALKGPTTTPIGSGYQSANVYLRKKLELYSCIRPIKSLPGIHTRYDNIDIVVIRENTEGLYSGKEIEVLPGCVVSLRTMTEQACLRISKAAFLYAQEQHRKKITLAHKANILKMGDGLWLSCGQKISQDFPDILFEDMIIDALCMKLVLQPNNFDIIVLENMFGDIVSDLCAGLVGGLGLVPSANMGNECAIFEAVHGSAPDIAGQGIANPTALIQSAVMMLHHLKEHEAALRIERALYRNLQEKSLKTKDLGGECRAYDFSKKLIENL